MFAIGIIVAIIALKKMYGEGRLNTLKTKLKTKSPAKTRLYQFPTLMIFEIIVLLLIGGGL